MNVFRLAVPGYQIPDEDAELAATLRRLACEVERGLVSRVSLTVTRPCGLTEELGHVPSITKIS